MRVRFLLSLLLLLVALPVAAQGAEDLPFSVEIVERDLTAMPALHSFAWAQYDGKWLLVAGRTDGLHGGLAGMDPDPFPTEFVNDAVWVVDPATDEVWSRSLDALDAALADPLRATNTEHHQDGETLYVVGGYGDDMATSEKITFPTLTAIDVPGMMEAVIAGDDLAPHLRQTADERLAVTGGELLQIDDRYYLIVGQRFDGEYVEGGEGTDFFQNYTEAIQSFRIEDDGASLSLVDVRTEVEDADHLHRRDLTVAPTVGSDDRLGFGLYGGVFQPNQVLPFLDPVYFEPDESDPVLTVDESFEQKIAHYTAPALPLYDAETGAMHTTFFGGMGLYFVNEETGEPEQDFLIPFIDDVATLTRTADGAQTETLQPFRMPALLGTNAGFIPTDNVPRYANEVVRLRDLTARTLVGHIVGGLVAEEPHPGRMGGVSGPSNRVFEVYVTPTTDTATDPTSAPLVAEVEAPFPNPFRTEATVAFVLDRDARVTVEVFDALGRRVARLHDGPLAGSRRHAFTFRPGTLPAGVYYARVHGDGFSETQPLVHVR